MGKTQQLGTLVDALFTDSSNNVGIGAAASGSYKLQVTGTTNLTGALTGTSITLTNALTALTLYSNAGLGLSLSGQFTGGGGYTGINGQALGIDIRPNSGGIFNLNFSSTTNRTFTFPDDSGTLVLGIGTTNYLPKFTGANTIGNSLMIDNGSNVKVTTTDYSPFYVNSTNANNWGANIVFQQSGADFGYFGALGSLLGSTDKGMTIYANTGNSIYLFTSGVNRFQVFSGGNVGVGTGGTDAGYKLDVNGTGRFSGDVTMTSAGSTTITNSGTTPILNMIRNNNASSPAAQINFKTSQGTTRWQIATNSATGTGFEINEGDGVNNRFYIAPSTGAATFSSSVTAGGTFKTTGGVFQLFNSSTFLGGLYSYATWLGSGTDYAPTLASATDLYFATGDVSTKKMVITSSGNVGIGVTPSGTDGIFSTNGYAGTLGDSTKRRALAVYSTAAENADQPGVILGYDTAGAGIVAAKTNATGQPLAFWTFNGTSWAEKMRITSGGNLLIGTTTDAGTKVNVSGTTKSTSFITESGTATIITQSSGWSTFYTVSNYQNAIYLVTLQLNGYSNYTAFATIAQNDSALVIMNQFNNTAQIQVSGLNIQGTQNSGSTQTMIYKIIKIA